MELDTDDQQELPLVGPHELDMELVDLLERDDQQVQVDRLARQYVYNAG